MVNVSSLETVCFPALYVRGFCFNPALPSAEHFSDFRKLEGKFFVLLVLHELVFPGNDKQKLHAVEPYHGVDDLFELGISGSIVRMVCCFNNFQKYISDPRADGAAMDARHMRDNSKPQLKSTFQLLDDRGGVYAVHRASGGVLFIVSIVSYPSRTCSCRGRNSCAGKEKGKMSWSSPSA